MLTRARFGSGFSLEAVEMWLVPLLAVPQLTHYVLDGFIWKRRTAPPLFEKSSTWPAVAAVVAPRPALENQ